MAVGSSRGVNYMRGFTWGISGEATVMSNLNKQLEEIKAKSEKGLVMAAAFALEQTEKVPPLTPVDTGNLRASRFISTASISHLGAVRGTGVGKFKGPRAGKMATDHVLVMEEAKGIVASQNNANKKVVMFGYTANYGGFVHEMIGANFQRPGAGPKWLEASLKRNTSKMVNIVRDNVKIKG